MKLPRRSFLHLAAGAAALPFAPHVARAQTYPSRPVRLIVPFSPAGDTDFRVRRSCYALTPVSIFQESPRFRARP
jgi:tripartite-type tricarboxylate transporter receptor subunit TctC